MGFGFRVGIGVRGIACGFYMHHLGSKAAGLGGCRAQGPSRPLYRLPRWFRRGPQR